MYRKQTNAEHKGLLISFCKLVGTNPDKDMITVNELRIGNWVNIIQVTGAIELVDVEIKEVKLEYDNNIGGDRTYIQPTDIDSGFEIKEIIIADGEYSGIELEFNTNANDGFILLYDLQHSSDLSDFTRAHDIVKKGTTLQFMLEKTEHKYFSFNGNFNLVDRLTPILLTAEILLKCGFKFNTYVGEEEIDYYILENSEFILDASFQPLVYGSSIHLLDYEIEYLHQLQNVYFALTGKELDIKL